MPLSANGLSTAIVLSTMDPSGKNRLLIQIPGNSAQGVWAEVARLDAGDQRGTIFLPEIGDKVVVGFENNNIDFPIVLGMLFNGANQSPLQPTPANHEKGIFTRSKLRIYFNDDKKIIIIDTPAGNSIQLNESSHEISIVDQNNNKFLMNSSGIQFESMKNISIKAGGSISLNSVTGIHLESKSDIKSTAIGSTSLKSKEIKLSGQGIVEIKGAKVKIN